MTPKELKDAVRVVRRFLEGERVDPDTGRRYHEPPISDMEVEFMFEMIGRLELFNAFPDRIEPALKETDKQWLLREVAKVQKMHSQRLKQKALIKAA